MYLLAAAVCGLLGAVGALPASPPVQAGMVASPEAGSLTVYHGVPAGSGDLTGIAAVDTCGPAWPSPVLDGQIEGEPLLEGGRVFAAASTTVSSSSTTTTTSAPPPARKGPRRDLPDGVVAGIVVVGLAVGASLGTLLRRRRR